MEKDKHRTFNVQLPTFNQKSSVDFVGAEAGGLLRILCFFAAKNGAEVGGAFKIYIFLRLKK